MSAAKDLDSLIAMLRSTSSAASRNRTAVSPAVGRTGSHRTVVSPPTTNTNAGPNRTQLSPPRPNPTAVAARQLFLSDDHLGSAEDRWARALRHEPFTDRSVSERSLRIAAADSVMIGAPTERPPLSNQTSPSRLHGVVHRIGTQVDTSPELDVRVVSPPRHRVKFVDPAGHRTTAPAMQSGVLPSHRTADAVHASASASMSHLLDHIASSGKPHTAATGAARRHHANAASRHLFGLDATYADDASATLSNLSAVGDSSQSGFTSRTGSTSVTPLSGTLTPPAPHLMPSLNNDEFVVLANIDRLQRRLDEVTRMKAALEAEEGHSAAASHPHSRAASVKQSADGSLGSRPAHGSSVAGAPPYVSRLHVELLQGTKEDEAQRRGLVEDQERLGRDRILAQWRRDTPVESRHHDSYELRLTPADRFAEHEQLLHSELMATVHTRRALVADERHRIERERAELAASESMLQRGAERSATPSNRIQRSPHHSPIAAATEPLLRILVSDEADRRGLWVDREGLEREQLRSRAAREALAIKEQLESERALLAVNAQLKAEVEAIAAAHRALADEERARIAAARVSLVAEAKAPVAQRPVSPHRSVSGPGSAMSRALLRVLEADESDRRALVAEREALDFDRMHTAFTLAVQAALQADLEVAEMQRSEEEAARLMQAKRAVVEAEMAQLAEERKQLERVRASRLTPIAAARQDRSANASFRDDHSIATGIDDDGSFVIAAYQRGTPTSSSQPHRALVVSPRTSHRSPPRLTVAAIELEESDSRGLLCEREAVERAKLQNAEVAHANDSQRLADARVAAEAEWEAEREYLEAQKRMMEESRQRLLTQQRVLSDAMRNQPAAAAVTPVRRHESATARTPSDGTHEDLTDRLRLLHRQRLVQLLEQQEMAQRDLVMEEASDARLALADAWARARPMPAVASSAVEDDRAEEEMRSRLRALEEDARLEDEYRRAMAAARAELDDAKRARDASAPSSAALDFPLPPQSASPARRPATSPQHLSPERATERLLEQVRRDEDLRRGIVAEIEDAERSRLALMERRDASSLITRLLSQQHSEMERQGAESEQTAAMVWDLAQRARDDDLRWMAAQVSEERRNAREALRLQLELDASSDWSRRMASAAAVHPTSDDPNATPDAAMRRMMKEERCRFLVSATLDDEEERRAMLSDVEALHRDRLQEAISVSYQTALQAERQRLQMERESRLWREEWQAATLQRRQLHEDELRRLAEERALISHVVDSAYAHDDGSHRVPPSSTQDHRDATQRLIAVLEDAQSFQRDVLRDAEQSGWEQLCTTHLHLRDAIAQRRRALAAPSYASSEPARSRSPSLDVQIERQSALEARQQAADREHLMRREEQHRSTVLGDYGFELDEIRSAAAGDRHAIEERSKLRRYWREQQLWIHSDERDARQLIFRQQEHAREHLVIDFVSSTATLQKAEHRQSSRRPPTSAPVKHDSTHRAKPPAPPAAEDDDPSPPRVVVVTPAAAATEEEEPSETHNPETRNNADAGHTTQPQTRPEDASSHPTSHANRRRAYSKSHGPVVDSEGTSSTDDDAAPRLAGAATTTDDGADGNDDASASSGHHNATTDPPTAAEVPVRRKPPAGKAKEKPIASEPSGDAAVAVRKSDFPESRPPPPPPPSQHPPATVPPMESAPSSTPPSSSAQPQEGHQAGGQHHTASAGNDTAASETPSPSPTRKVSMVHRPPPSNVTPERMSLMRTKSALARANSSVSRSRVDGPVGAPANPPPPTRPIAHTFTPRTSRSNSPAAAAEAHPSSPAPAPMQQQALTEDHYIARAFDVIADGAAAAVRLRSSLRAYATRLAREHEQDRQEDEDEEASASARRELSAEGAGSPGLKFMDSRATRRVLLRLRIREERDTADTLRQSIVFGANFAAAAAAVLRVCGGEGNTTFDWTPPDSGNNSRSASVVTGGSSRGSLTVAGAFEDVPWVRYDELLDTMRTDVRSMAVRVAQQRKTVAQLLEAGAPPPSSRRPAAVEQSPMQTSTVSGGGGAFEAAMEATVSNLELEYRQSLSRMRFAEMCLSVLVELYHAVGQGDAAVLPPDSVVTPLLLEVIQHHLAREAHDDDADPRGPIMAQERMQQRRLLSLIANDPLHVPDPSRAALPLLVMGLPTTEDRYTALPLHQDAYDAVQRLWFDQDRINRIQAHVTADAILARDNATTTHSGGAILFQRATNDDVYFVTRRHRLRLDVQHRQTAELLDATRRANRHVTVLNAPQHDPLAATMRPAAFGASPLRYAPNSQMQASQLTRPKTVGDLLPAIQASLAETVEFGALSAAAGTQLLTAELSMRAAAELVRSAQHQSAALDVSPIRQHQSQHLDTDHSSSNANREALDILVQQLQANEALLSSRQLALDVLSRELEGLRKIVNAVPLTLPTATVLRSGGLERITRQRLLGSAMREHVALSVELAGHIANSHHRMDLALRRERLQGGVLVDDDDDPTDGGAAALLRLSDRNAVEEFLQHNPSVAAKHEKRAIRGAEKTALERDVAQFVAAHEQILLAIQHLNSAVSGGALPPPGKATQSTPSAFRGIGSTSTVAGTTGPTGDVSLAEGNPVLSRRVDPVDATISQLRGAGVIVYYDPSDFGAGSRAPIDASSAPGTARRLRRAATFAGLAADSGAKDFYSRAYAMRLGGPGGSSDHSDESMLNLYDIAAAPGSTSTPAYSFELNDIASVSEPYSAGISLKSAVSVQLSFHSGRSPAVLVFASSVSQEAWLAAMVKLTQDSPSSPLGPRAATQANTAAAAAAGAAPGASRAPVTPRGTARPLEL